MIHRLHNRHLNNYLAFYLQEIHRRGYNKPKGIRKEKLELVEIVTTKAKMIGAMA